MSHYSSTYIKSKQRRNRRAESPPPQPMNNLTLTSQTEDIYSQIIEEVTRSMRHKFQHSGVPEQTLQKVKETWERKLKDHCSTSTSVFDTAAVYGEAKPFYTKDEEYFHSNDISSPSPAAQELKPEPETSSPPEDESDFSEASEDEYDPLKAKFEQTKTYNEKIKEEIKEMPDHEEVEGVSDEETNIDSPVAEDVMYCMYNTVKRSGSKWTVNLEGCILRVMGQDHIYRTVNGDFDFYS